MTIKKLFSRNTIKNILSYITNQDIDSREFSINLKDLSLILKLYYQFLFNYSIPNKEIVSPLRQVIIRKIKIKIEQKDDENIEDEDKYEKNEKNEEREINIIFNKDKIINKESNEETKDNKYLFPVDRPPISLNKDCILFEYEIPLLNVKGNFSLKDIDYVSTLLVLINKEIEFYNRKEREFKRKKRIETKNNKEELNIENSAMLNLGSDAESKIENNLNNNTEDSISKDLNVYEKYEESFYSSIFENKENKIKFLLDKFKQFQYDLKDVFI